MRNYLHSWSTKFNLYLIKFVDENLKLFITEYSIQDWLDRSDDDDFIVHAVFTLVRNILSIKSERQISEESDINAHDLVLW